ncbi:hypothetical protein [Streptomyces sp. MI02-7b]|uniref:hypothetical protein n=1 Tax=Streptomyces sp. MI02-7b TaxID=462941 RepID=UPI0029A9DD0D|nr:hypothetical protein [Streptomyces sp. MI02-7b]MDX3071366.1 hypothetical protein [Streptomyces sp. MI02-7b]
MLFLVAALALFGLVLGPVAQLPLHITLVAAAAIGVWLALYGIRGRLAHRGER